jgi:hypothetical protein
VFLQKSPQTIENKGRGREKELQESLRARKRMNRRDLRLVTRDRFTVLSCKLLVSEGEGQGEDWLTAEFREGAEGTGDKALRHRGHRAGLDDGRDRKGAAEGESGWSGSGRGSGLGGCGATFTAHDSRRGTRGQLVEGTVEVQLN